VSFCKRGSADRTLFTAISITVSGVVAGIDSKLYGGTHTAADAVAKAQAVLSEPELLRAMFDVG
jgi:hypothetical protein